MTAAPSLLSGRKLGLLGAGNMAEALARGVIKSGAVGAGDIIASDIAQARREVFASFGARTTQVNRDVIAFADVIVLCVKPQQADDVVRGIAPAFEIERQVLATICAGISSTRLEKLLPHGARVVRVMPNTPMLIGLGASGVAAGSHARDIDVATVEALFATASMTVRVAEPLIDAVTGLSGSGPAYLFYLVEAMTDAGVAEGFTLEQARALATRTVLGASKMLEETGLPPEELRRRVTSPNGTTQAAIELLDARHTRAALSDAVRRAAERSRELGRGSK